MNAFDWPRFRRLFCNDLLQQWRKLWIATLGLGGIGVGIFLISVRSQPLSAPVAFETLFSLALLVCGPILTSAVFADLHHPLQKFQYLTLPCSNLERFLSRYLLSAPLYYLYAVAAFAVFDPVATLIANVAIGTHFKPFASFGPFASGMGQVTLAYFALHALMFAGAIYFRSHALVKTLLSGVLIGLGLTIVQLVSVRVLYASYFSTLWMAKTPLPSHLILVPSSVVTAAEVVAAVWVLFIAYQSLREYEVQGGV